MVPASGGRFEVSLDGELLYSKASTGRHANPGEIAAHFRARLGPELLG
jgi:selenoprotein W-related protein